MKQSSVGLILIILSILVMKLKAIDHYYINSPGEELKKWFEDNKIRTCQHPDERIWEFDLQENMIDSFLEKNPSIIAVRDSDSISRDLEGYRSYDDLTSELNQIAVDFPDIVELSSLGKSLCHIYYDQGKLNYEDYQHEIWCLKLSDNPSIDEDEPNVFLGSSIHARETISLEVDMHILYYLVSNYGVNDSVTFWIDNTQIWFIPLINPDGHKLVIEQLYTYHRKNMRDNNNNNIPDYSTVDGVDLNRNFDFHWNGPYSSPSTTSESYRGTAPWSEPETQYLRDLLQAHKFYGGITYHSYGQVVLYPPGHQPSAMGYDHAAMSELATEMADTIPNIDNNGYYSPQSANTYLASGSMGDWGYGVERIFSFTIELSKAPYFHPPASWIQPICEANLEAALIMIDRVHKAAVTGNITDTSGNPLVAEVYVDEIDYQPGMSEVDPVRSGNTFGRYYRLLLPGNYNFTFISDEFGQIEIPDVTVSSDSITQLNVVFGFEFADSLSIEVIDNQIILDWLSEPEYSYEVMSSSNPYNDFEVDETGFYLDENSWQSEITEERRFFRVRRQ